MKYFQPVTRIESNQKLTRDELISSHLYTINRVVECWSKMPVYFSQEIAETRKRLMTEISKPCWFTGFDEIPNV